MKKSNMANGLWSRTACWLSAGFIIALTLGGCGSKKDTRADATNASVPISGDGNTPDVAGATAPADPAAADVLSNPQTGAQVASAALDSAVSAAAAGTSGAGSVGGYALVEKSVENFDIPAQPNQTTTIAKGSLNQDCYLGTTIAARTSSSTPSWPESADSASVFSGSKNDSTAAAQMYVEPALLQYPATTPTSTLTLAAPFLISDMVEVIQKDTRQSQTTLADKAKTSISTTGDYEEHRFWIAKNPITGAKKATMSCVPTKGANAKGSSGSANGKWAKIAWTDASQPDGLSMLARLTRTGTRSKSYLPKVKGVLASTPAVLNWKTTISGERLTQWTKSTDSASTVTGAALVVQKTITHSLQRSDIRLDASGTAQSTISGLDEVRATTPLVIQEFRDSSESALAHVIAGGTIYRTALDSAGTVKWFSSLAFEGVKFDHVNSSEICIPVAGTVTLTVFDKEGGSQKGQIVITYASADSTTSSGKIDPSISVTGDDAEGTRAQWMMLSVNRRCEFKN